MTDAELAILSILLNKMYQYAHEEGTAQEASDINLVAQLVSIIQNNRIVTK